MYAGGILSFYFIWFNPIRMSFQLCFISKCEENKEVIPKMDWKWPMPKMSEKLTDAGTIADPSSFHWEQHGGKWWPPPNEKLTRKLGSINQRDKSFLIRNSKKCPLLKNFVILLWLLDSKHFSQAIDIPFSNFRSCQQEANYMLVLENCKEADSVIPMQLLVQVELLELVELGLELVQSVTPMQFLVWLPLPPWAEANFVGGGIGWRRVINSAKCIQCSETIKPSIEQSDKYTSCSDAMMWALCTIWRRRMRHVELQFGETMSAWPF